MKDSGKFHTLVRQCLALPFIEIRELQPTVDDLASIDMGNEEVNLDRDKWKKYIRDTWINGIYSPEYIH